MLPWLSWAIALVATALLNRDPGGKSAPFHYGGETFETYYKTYGLQGSSKPPLIALHGGPGLSFDYLEVLSDLSGSRPIVLYDQIGNGRSSHLKDKPSSFWTIDLFIKQLESLISHLDLKGYDVLGHSWGGMLASEFAVTQPKGLKKLVLSNSPPSAELWAKSLGDLTPTFPSQVQQALAGGDPSFGAALLGYFHVYGSILDSWPRDLNVSLEYTFSDPTADVQMWGGPLATWTVVDRLPKIKVPTLVINGGANDITNDQVIQPLLAGIPKVKHHKFENCTHMPFLVQRPAYLKVVRKFLEKRDYKEFIGKLWENRPSAEVVGKFLEELLK